MRPPWWTRWVEESRQGADREHPDAASVESALRLAGTAQERITKRPNFKHIRTAWDQCRKIVAIAKTVTHSTLVTPVVFMVGQEFDVRHVGEIGVKRPIDLYLNLRG